MRDKRLLTALDSLPEIQMRIGGRKPVFFLDFDGTLAPLAPDPDRAALPPETRGVLQGLARDHLVCLVSGRGLTDLRDKVALPEIWYAADHGYRVLGPPGSDIALEVGPEDRLELEQAATELEGRLRSVEGVIVEAKGQSLSVHYRLVAENERPLVAETVREVAEASPGLRLGSGKLVHEFRPDIDWGKGKAMLWVLGRLRLGRTDACPICIGDDVTDEDMFVAMRGWGVGIVVGRPDRPTAAEFTLPDTAATARFLSTYLDG